MHIWFKHIKQECIKHAMICFYIIVSTLYTILNLPYAKLHCLLLLAKAMSVLIMSGGGWDSLFHQGPLHRPHRNLCSSTPRHPSALTLEAAELFLSHFLTHLSELPLCSRFFFFFFFMNSALPGSGVAALASSGSLSEPAGVVSDLK